MRYDVRHDRVLGFSGFRVTSPPGPAGALTVREDDDTEKLRIGDPHRAVTGTQTYAIDYDVDRALTRDASGPLLTWNAIGAEWGVPITRADVTVRSPVPIQDVTCAAGAEHATARCERAMPAGTTAMFAATGLPTHAGLTVRVGLRPGGGRSPRGPGRPRRDPGGSGRTRPHPPGGVPAGRRREAGPGDPG
ncbi:hypothetical protein GCM10023191_039830 [Actinoallomurus oryzae]|uniref:DUF2207 domain-containing protein n=1 Tax=Actinoallomurus oryzae TaxID=502180 RepID=A0ABP8Q3L7_9ACTN